MEAWLLTHVVKDLYRIKIVLQDWARQFARLCEPTKLQVKCFVDLLVFIEVDGILRTFLVWLLRLLALRRWAIGSLESVLAQCLRPSSLSCNDCLWEVFHFTRRVNETALSLAWGKGHVLAQSWLPTALACLRVRCLLVVIARAFWCNWCRLELGFFRVHWDFLDLLDLVCLLNVFYDHDTALGRYRKRVYLVQIWLFLRVKLLNLEPVWSQFCIWIRRFQSAKCDLLTRAYHLCPVFLHQG